MNTISTRLLEISYRDDGDEDAPVVILHHGWPDDASTWNDIIPSLNEAGFRTIVPTARGFGGTRFLSPSSLRTGNTAILAPLNELLFQVWVTSQRASRRLSSEHVWPSISSRLWYSVSAYKWEGKK